jgi:hypothetical protein
VVARPEGAAAAEGPPLTRAAPSAVCRQNLVQPLMYMRHSDVFLRIHTRSLLMPFSFLSATSILMISSLLADVLCLRVPMRSL